MGSAMAKPRPTSANRSLVADRLTRNTAKLFEFVLRQVRHHSRTPEWDESRFAGDRYALKDATYALKDATDTIVEFSPQMLDTAFERIQANLTPGPEIVDPETGHLTIIEPAEVELGLHVAALSAPQAERHARVLREVQALLPRLSPVTNPHALDPDMLLGALSAQIAHTGLSEEAKRIACQLLLNELEPHLESFYRAALKSLRHLPPTETETAVEPPVEPEPIPTTRTDTSTLVVIPEKVLRTGVHTAMAAQDAPSEAAAHALSPFERDTIVEAFTAMQRERLGKARLLPPEVLTQRVATVLYQQGAFNTAHLTEAVAPVSQFVYEVFAAVLGDATLPTATRPALAALQVPISKLAFMELEAFRNPERPARQLLRTYTALAAHAAGPDAKRVVEGMTRATRFVCERFDRDTRILVRALQALSRLLREVERRAERREHEAQAARRRQARLRAAREEVLARYRERVRGTALHPRVTAFLEHAWLPCMARVLAFQGRSSAAWREAECLFEQLALAGTGSLSIERFDAILGPLDTFEADLSARLGQCDSPDATHELERLMRWLRATRFRALQSAASMELPPHRTPHAETLEIEPLEPPTEEQPMPSSEPEAEAKLGPDTGSAPMTAAPGLERPPAITAAALPPSVRPGTWFQIHQHGRHAKRHLKLSTILPDTGEVLFASRSGEEALTLPIEQFLEDLRTGRSRPIEDTNRFEEALQVVIRNRSTQEP